MPVLTKTELINDPVVRSEIDRYKWLESEKLGRDIGFDKAAEEWINRCSGEWFRARGIIDKKPVRKIKSS